MSGILKVGGSELVNDNGGSGALQWGTGVPAGSILQVQTGFSNSAIEMSAATGVRNIGVSASITPKFSGSTVLVYASMQCGSSGSSGMGLTIKRTGPSDQTLQKGDGNGTGMNAGKITFFASSNWDAMLVPLSGMFTDTTQDNTTPHVYNIQLDTNNSVGVMINRRWSSLLWMGTTQIIVMEIKA